MGLNGKGQGERTNAVQKKESFLCRIANRWRRGQTPPPFECSGGRLLATVVSTFDLDCRSCR